MGLEDGRDSMKPYYESEGIVIYNCDCREILSQLEPVDLVLTDPPYGINKAEWDNAFPRWFVLEAFKCSQSVCIMPGLWALPECIDAMGGRYKWVIAGFNKNGMAHGAIGYNNWIPAVCGGIVKNGGQDAFSFTIGREKQFKHPSQKPLPFMNFLVNRLTDIGQIILDPFMGSGTTLVAAKQYGRKCIGIEIEEKYAEIAAKRLAQSVFDFT
jgi:site-specific DNA-methyltransferase (adenine-specific)